MIIIDKIKVLIHSFIVWASDSYNHLKKRFPFIDVIDDFSLELTTTLLGGLAIVYYVLGEVPGPPTTILGSILVYGFIFMAIMTISSWVARFIQKHKKKLIAIALTILTAVAGFMGMAPEPEPVGAEVPQIVAIWPDNGDTFSIDDGTSIPVAVIGEDPNGDDVSIGIRINSGTWSWQNNIDSGECALFEYSINVNDDTSYTLDVRINDDGDTSADDSDTGNTIYSYDMSAYRNWTSWNAYTQGDFTHNPSYAIDDDIDTYARTDSFAWADGEQTELYYYAENSGGGNLDVVNTRWAMWDPETAGRLDDIDYRLLVDGGEVDSALDMDEGDIPQGEDGNYWDWTDHTGGKDFFTIDEVKIECDYRDTAGGPETSPSIYEMHYMLANPVQQPQLVYPPDSGDVSPLGVGLTVSVNDYDGLGNNGEAERLDWYVYAEKNDATPDTLYASGTSDQLKTIVYYNLYNLDEDSTYYWKVKVVDEFGNEQTSDVFSFDTKAAPSLSNPDPYDDETGVSLSPTLYIDVSNDVGDSTIVQFRDASDSSLIGTMIDVSNGDTAFYTWSDADQYETQYQWYVYAYDADGSTTSSTYTFTTVGNENPSASNPRPPNGNFNCSADLTLYVDVTDPESESMDVCFWKADGTFLGKDSGVSSGSTASYFAYEIFNEGDTVNWYVTLDDGTNNVTQPSSGTWYFDINDWPTCPSNPSPANETEIESTSVTLSITLNDPDGTSDTLEAYFYNDSSGAEIGHVTGINPGSTASVDWDGLQDGYTYEWSVFTGDSCYLMYNTSMFFGPYNFTINLSEPPDKPTLNLPSDGTELADPGSGGTMLSVGYSGPSVDLPFTIEYYIGQGGSTPVFEGSNVINSQASGTDFINVSLDGGHDYDWYAKIIDDQSQSNTSDIWEFTLNDNASFSNEQPDDGSTVNKNDITEVSVQVSDIDSWNWWINTTDSSANSSGSSSGTTTISDSVSNLDYSSRYDWTVEVIDSYGHKETRSYSFNTTDEPNDAPNKPQMGSPNNSSIYKLDPINLSAYFSDPDGDNMVARFFATAPYDHDEYPQYTSNCYFTRNFGDTWIPIYGNRVMGQLLQMYNASLNLDKIRVVLKRSSSVPNVPINVTIRETDEDNWEPSGTILSWGEVNAIDVIPDTNVPYLVEINMSDVELAANKNYTMVLNYTDSGSNLVEFGCNINDDTPGYTSDNNYLGTNSALFYSSGGDTGPWSKYDTDDLNFELLGELENAETENFHWNLGDDSHEIDDGATKFGQAVSVNNNYTSAFNCTGLNLYGKEQVTNSNTNLGIINVTIRNAISNVGETRKISDVDSTWSTLNFYNTYDNPIVVAISNTTSGDDDEKVVRIKNIGSTSCEIRLQNPNDNTTVGPSDVYALIVEEGEWLLDSNVPFKAGSVDIDNPNNKNNWSELRMELINCTYDNPIVLGQVASFSDSDWSTFWCSDGNGDDGTPPNGGDIYVGSHVGADSDTTRATETIHYIIFDSFISDTGTTDNGIDFEVSLSSDSVEGFDDANSPYNIYYSGGPVSGIATIAAMDDSDGGWAILYGSDPFDGNFMDVCIDEDTLEDGERSHTTEQVGYILFDSLGNLTMDEPLPGDNIYSYAEWNESEIDRFQYTSYGFGDNIIYIPLTSVQQLEPDEDYYILIDVGENLTSGKSIVLSTDYIPGRPFLNYYNPNMQYNYNGWHNTWESFHFSLLTSDDTNWTPPLQEVGYVENINDDSYSNYEHKWTLDNGHYDWYVYANDTVDDSSNSDTYSFEYRENTIPTYNYGYLATGVDMNDDEKGFLYGGAAINTKIRFQNHSITESDPEDNITLLATMSFGGDARTPTLEDNDAQSNPLSSGWSDYREVSTTYTPWQNYEGNINYKLRVHDGWEYSNIIESNISEGLDLNAPVFNKLNLTNPTWYDGTNHWINPYTDGNLTFLFNYTEAHIYEIGMRIDWIRSYRRNGLTNGTNNEHELGLNIWGFGSISSGYLDDLYTIQDRGLLSDYSPTINLINNLIIDKERPNNITDLTARPDGYSDTGNYDDDGDIYVTWNQSNVSDPNLDDGNAGSGVDTVYVDFEDSSPNTDAGMDGEQMFTGLSEGIHTVYARCQDNVNLYSYVVTDTITVDMTNPDSEITSIPDTTTGPIIIQGNATDNFEVDSVYLTLQNDSTGDYWNPSTSEWGMINTFSAIPVDGDFDEGSESWYYDTNLPNWAYNTYTIDAGSYDAAGNAQSPLATESFTVVSGSNLSSIPYTIPCHNVTITATNETSVDNITLYWRESEDNSTGWSSWTDWNNESNPDETWPFEWNFVFPDGEGYYEFYTRAYNNGVLEPEPNEAEAICHNVFADISADIENPTGPSEPIILQEQTWANLTVLVDSNCPYDNIDVDFMNTTSWDTIASVNDNEPGYNVYYNWTDLSYNYTYNWQVNITSTSGSPNTSSNQSFILNDIPELTNFRIETIASDNAYLEWDNPDDILWFQITISNENSWVSKMTNDSGNITIGDLLPSTVYNAEWSAGDSLNGVAEYRDFNFSTYGWNTDYYDYGYKRLINISPDTITSDLEGYSFNFTLTEDNFNVQDNWWDPITPSFTKMLSNGDDIRFTDYYDTTNLKYNITSWSVPGDGGVSEDDTEDETHAGGSFVNPSYAWDDDWNTKTSADTDGTLFINFTKPADVLTADYKNEFHIYAGTDIYLGLLNQYVSGSEVRLKADMNYTESYIDLKLYNWSSSSYENFDYYDYSSGSTETSNITSRYFYDSAITWAFDCEVNISVTPLHFNDETQELGEGIDANYTTKMWMYYGNSEATNNETILSPSGYEDTAEATIGDEIDKFLPSPVISNLTTEVWNDAGNYKVNVTWNNSINCNNYLYYSENPWNANATLWNYSEDKTEVFEDQIGNKIHVNRLYAHGDELESYSVDCSNSSFDDENTYWTIDDSPVDDNTYFNVSNCNTTELLTWWVNYTYNKSEVRSSASPEYVMSGLDSHKTYYIQAKAVSVINESRNDTEDSSFVIDGLNPAPVASIISYTEDRPNETITLTYEVTDMNAQGSIDVSVQYINGDDDILYETSPVTRSSTGTYTQDISVSYDHEYEYRLKIEGSNTNYSEIYSNWFMPIGPFFAGNYIEDDDNNGNLTNVRHRQYLPPLENTSIDLDGTGDYYNCGDVSNLHGDLTISFWAKPTGDRLTRQNPIGKAYGGEFAITFEDEPSPNYINYYWGTTGLNSGDGGSTYENRGWDALLLDEWAHYCFVRNNTAETLDLYVNGELQSSGGDGWLTPVDSSLPLYIGNGYTNELEGGLDEVMLFDRPLSQTEVNHLYDGMVYKNGLIHYWSMDDATGGITDGIGSDNGVVSGNPQDTYNTYFPHVDLNANPIEQYGYWEGSEQDEDWMWVETNITDNIPLTIHLYKENGTHVGNYTMTNDSDSDMQYKNITGLGQDWYTFYITDSTSSVVLDWTKPGPYHRMGESRTDESKYVKFGGTKTTDDLDYRLMYLDWFYYNTSAYRYTINEGYDLYEAMSVTYWGQEGTGIPDEDQGTKYDRGQLFRGGVTNGENQDSGMISDERLIYPLGSFDGIYNNPGMDDNPQRHCFSFTAYWFNESALFEDEIENWYFRFWQQDAWYSTYLGRGQTALWGGAHLFTWQPDTSGDTRDWAMYDGSQIGEYEGIPTDEYTLDSTNYTKQTTSNTTFDSTYNQHLMVGHRDLSTPLQLYQDQAYNLGVAFDGRWPNQQIGEHQQAYVIFNLPDNDTLNSSDSDGDGLNDYDEIFVYYTNPKCNDTDEDGDNDYQEVYLGTDPNLYTDVNTEPELTLVSPNDNAINVGLNDDLEWIGNDENAGVLNYSVYFQKDDASPEYVGYTSGMNYDPGELDIDSTYYWKINVTDGYLYNESEVYSFTTRDYNYPDAPYNFDAEAVNTTSIYLDWIKGDYMDSVYIEWNTSSDSWPKGQGNFLYNGSDTYTYHNNLNSNTKYNYQAWCWNNDDGVWSQTNSSSNATTGIDYPPYIHSVSPSNGTTIQQKSVDWNCYIGDSISNVDWTIECSNLQSTSGTDDPDGTHWLNMSGLSFGDTYTIWVNATDGSSWVRNWYTFSIRDAYTPTIYTFEAQTINRTAIDIICSVNYHTDYFVIENNSTPDWNEGEGNELLNSTSSTSYTHNDLEFDTTYYYRVFAHNTTDNLNAEIFTSNSTAGNDAPTIQYPDPINESQTGSNYVLWSIYISDGNGDDIDWEIETSTLSNSSLNDGDGRKYLNITDINQGDEITIWVNASDDWDTTNRWYTISRPKEDTPNEPQNFRVTDKTYSSISLAWSIDAKTDVTRVEWSATSDDWDVGNGNLVVNASTTTTTDNTVPEGTTRYYRAWNYNDSVNAWSSDAYTYDTTLGNLAPTIESVSPINQSSVAYDIGKVSVYIEDEDDSTVNWSIESPTLGTASGTGNNERVQLTFGDLGYGETHYWWVNISSAGKEDKEYYWFTTEYPGHLVFYDPVPSNQSENNSLSLTAKIYMQPSDNPDGVFSWWLNSTDGTTNSGMDDTQGYKEVSLSGLSYSTTYRVYANATYNGNWTRQWWEFTTIDEPSPGFSVSPEPIYNEPVYFTDSSSGSINNRWWTFGDGNTSSEKNPSHTYVYPGNYTVTLSINDNATSISHYAEVGAIISAREGEDYFAWLGDNMTLQQVGGTLSATSLEYYSGTGWESTGTYVIDTYDVLKSNELINHRCAPNEDINYGETKTYTISPGHTYACWRDITSSDLEDIAETNIGFTTHSSSVSLWMDNYFWKPWFPTVTPLSENEDVFRYDVLYIYNDLATSKTLES